MHIVPFATVKKQPAHLARRAHKDCGPASRALVLGGAAALICVMLMHLAVNLNLTLYSDDYWYGTFFQNGPAGFWEQTVAHYQNTNGRVLVHILIPLLLLADVKLFAILSPLLTAAIFLLALRTQNFAMGRGALLLGTALSLLTLLGSEIEYLRMSLYWLAAYFNYAFPLLFPLAALWGMFRLADGRQKTAGFVVLCLCCALAGASTEQCGLASLVMIWGRWFQLRRQTENKRRLLVCPLTVSLFYLTVLLAPGSHARMDRGIDGGLLSVLQPAVFFERFFDVMHYLCGYWFWNLLFAALCLLSALLWWIDRTLPKMLLAGLPAAILVVALSALGLDRPLAVLTVSYTLYLAILLLRQPKLQTTALLLLGAGASVMMLTVTTLYYARTFFPCILLVIAVCWSLLLRLTAHVPRPATAVVCGLLILIFVGRYIPILQGYTANKVVIDQNLAAIAGRRPGEPLTLNIDLAADYRFTMFFEGAYFLSNFRQYYQIPADTEIRFTSREWNISDVRIGDTISDFPALAKDGQLLLPIDFVFQNLGETCRFDWSGLAYTLTRAGRTYTLGEDGRLLEHCADGVVRQVDDSCNFIMPFSYTYTLLYMPADDLARCFGITFAYDAASDCYYLPSSIQ